MAGIILISSDGRELSNLAPILKWPGGKRWLVRALAKSVGLSAHSQIVEPFVGGGALFFDICPKAALLGDINTDLIACYRAIRDTPAAVNDVLRQLMIDRETYADIAATEPLTDIDRAVRLIYLNRTAFGGIWRVNQMGKFNVPFGCKPETRLPDSTSIERTSEALQAAALYAGDFALGLKSAEDSDLIYCDPPYTVSHNNNGFIRYNERIFSWADQCRLAESVEFSAKEGRGVIVSNAAHNDVLKLYSRKLFARVIVYRTSNLAADPQYRGARQEALLVSRTLVRSDNKLRDALGSWGLNVEFG
jgi:DNA adenine methylase